MLVRALTLTIMRTRSRSTIASLNTQVQCRKYKPTLQVGADNNSMSAFPLQMSGQYVTTWTPVSGRRAEYNSSETISDENSPRDGVKYVSHEKRTGYGDIPIVEYAYAPGTAYEYPSPSAPRRAYAGQRSTGCQTLGTACDQATSQALMRISTGSSSELRSYLNSQGVIPPDRLGEVSARLVSKLEQLYLANTAYEAREVPELLDLFKKRNLLAGPRGAKWVTGWALDGAGRSMVTRTGMASMAFLKYLSGNYLGYTFGLMPTVGDAAAICGALKNGLQARRTRVSATIVGHGQAERSTKLWSGTGMVSGLMQEKSEIHRVDGVRATLVNPTYHTDFFNRMLPALLGLNGAQRLWEAVPFSWCVDYFLSIDDVLDILYCQSQTEYKLEYWSSEKMKYERRVCCSYICDYNGSTTASPVYADSPTVRAEYSQYVRTPRTQPSAFDGLRSRLAPRKVFTMAMVAIGLVSGARIPKYWMGR